MVPLLVNLEACLLSGQESVVVDLILSSRKALVHVDSIVSFVGSPDLLTVGHVQYLRTQIHTEIRVFKQVAGTTCTYCTKTSAGRRMNIVNNHFNIQQSKQTFSPFLNSMSVLVQ